jgi:hypothetical protein
MPGKLTRAIIAAAIQGFEAQKTLINAQIAELRALQTGGPTVPAAPSEGAPPKRRISAAARRRMALGQRARWAKIKRDSKPSAPVAKPVPVKPRRKLSAAAKVILVASLKKARAAKAAKAKGAKKAPPTSKKAAVKKTAVKAPSAIAAKKTMSPARKAAMVANLAKARAARAAKRAAAA